MNIFSAVTASVANVVEKWDFCFQKVQDAASENSEESTTGFKNVCVCFEKDNSGASDKDLGNNFHILFGSNNFFLKNFLPNIFFSYL